MSGSRRRGAFGGVDSGIMGSLFRFEKITKSNSVEGGGGRITAFFSSSIWVRIVFKVSALFSAWQARRGKPTRKSLVPKPRLGLWSVRLSNHRDGPSRRQLRSGLSACACATSVKGISKRLRTQALFRWIAFLNCDALQSDKKLCFSIRDPPSKYSELFLVPSACIGAAGLDQGACDVGHKHFFGGSWS